LARDLPVHGTVTRAKRKNRSRAGSPARLRKDGRYEARATLNTTTGQRWLSIYGATAKEAEDERLQALADQAKGIIFADPGQLTVADYRDGGITYDAGKLAVGEYLNRWLSDSVRDTVRQRTYERYEQLVRVHIVPALGRLKLKNVTPAHVRGLCRSKLEDGLAPRTVQYIHRTLSKALEQAVNDGLIPRNAASSVKPPQPHGEEIRPLDPGQVRSFLASVSGDRLEALYVVAITAGLRQGELLGLRWEDVDLDAGTLQVRRTLSEARSGRIFEAPKSGKGRSIRLTSKATEALRGHRKRQLEEKLRLGSLWQENGLVFPSQVGTPLGGRNLIRHFKRMLERSGLARTFRFHDFRHTCATLLLKQGVHVKFVQELLGHGDVSLTLNVYSHVLPDMGDAGAGAMDEVLG
jgi:integrase